jgi:hypothetical protein
VSCEGGISRVRQLGNGLFLKRDDIGGSYAIIRYNSRTYQSDGVLVVVRGKATADSELKRFEECQDSLDRHEGWRYFIEKIDLKAGTDPTEATQHRQAELESRELKALQEIETPNSRSQNHRR